MPSREAPRRDSIRHGSHLHADNDAEELFSQVDRRPIPITPDNLLDQESHSSRDTHQPRPQLCKARFRHDSFQPEDDIRWQQPLSLTRYWKSSPVFTTRPAASINTRCSCRPMTWWRRRRLDLALEQLTQASSTDSVSTMAQRCGDLSAANFSRDFSSAKGRQPSDILRANPQRQEP